MPQIRIRDEAGAPVQLINVRLAANGQDEESAYDDKFTDLAGNTAWPNPINSPSGYDLYVNYRNVNEKFKTFTGHYPSLNENIDITLESNVIKLERVVIDGYFAKTGKGPFFFRGETGFLDYYRYLRGEDITPLLRQSQALKSNGRRNFFMTVNTGIAGGIGICNPDDFGNDFYDKLPSFLDLYQDHGLYLYSSIYPDNQLLPNWAGNNAKQVGHWNRLNEIFRSLDNVFAVELTNEPDGHSFNQVDTAKFAQPSGIISCAGSYGVTGGDPMPGPNWSMRDFHSPRGYPNSVSDANVANHPNRLRGEAILLGEPLGFGPGRETNPRIAKEIAGSAVGTAIGIVFHSQHGGFSQLYDSNEQECARAWFEILNGV